MDTIRLILEIVLCFDILVMLWAGYIWYLDRLWDWRDRLNQLETPTWVVVDQENREIARYD